MSAPKSHHRQVKKLLKQGIIQAFADGADVQYLRKRDAEWIDYHALNIQPGTKWRIKPNPKTCTQCGGDSPVPLDADKKGKRLCRGCLEWEEPK